MSSSDFNKTIISFLGKVPLFKGLSNNVLKTIFNNVKERTFYHHDIIYFKGDLSKYIYIIRYGEVMLKYGKTGQSVKYLGPGEVFSESSILAGTPHSGSAIASIDSKIYLLDGKFFLDLAKKEKQLSQNLVIMMSLRLRDHMEENKSSSEKKRFICHIPLESIPHLPEKLMEMVDTERDSFVGDITLIESDKFLKKDFEEIYSQLSKIRKKSSVIHLYFNHSNIDSKFDKLILQADQIVFWENETEHFINNKRNIMNYWKSRIRNFHSRSIRVILSKSYNLPENLIQNQKIYYFDEHFSRILISKTRGLTLGGGGARALAHIGLIRVLEQIKIKFDLVSGSSFGAVIGALYARGDSSEEMLKNIEKYFGGPKKPFDPTLPIVSFFKGKRMERMLKDAFGDQLIEELEIPFVTSAVDLHGGKQYIFDKGPIWEALTAAMSLPGAFPPRLKGQLLLIDGGVLNNIPENLIREKGADEIMCVNVSPLRDDKIIKIIEGKKITQRSFSINLWENIKYPPILRVMERAITLGGREITLLKKNDLDLFLNFHLEEFGFFDFGKFREIVDKGESEATSSVEEIKNLFIKRKG